MADINISGSGNFSGNNYNVPNPVAGTTKVSFHSADDNVTVCFDNEPTFGTWSLSLTKGKKTDLTIQAVQNTNYTINNSGTTCPQSKSPKGGPGYTITMGGNVPKEHGRY
jgi:hypothetical protein